MKYNHLAGLNSQQRKAVLHGRDKHLMCGKPLVVIAGAGSGKTKVLASRVVHLVLNGVDPSRILLMTFTKKAAGELVNRVANSVSRAMHGVSVQFPWAGTFHSVALKLLERYGRHIGVAGHFTVMDRGDAEDLMGIVRHDIGLGDQAMFPQKDLCLALHSYRINSRRSLKSLLRSRYPSLKKWRKQLDKLFAVYKAEKRKQNVLDYDDLVSLFLKLLKTPECASEVRGLFDHVLVDEYQDTNRLQARILQALKPEGIGLTVVGDDAQSIYSFRAADVRNILEFPVEFPEAAKIVTLEQNYRSTQPILDASNAVIGLAKERFTKNLFSERASHQKPTLTRVRDATAQAKHVAATILEAREEGVSLRNQAVLFRASQHSALLEIELAKQGIPFEKWGGIKFVEAAHIKDALSVLRWCSNPADRVAAFRVLQLMPGIGPRKADGIFNQMSEARLIQGLKNTMPPKLAATEWPSFVKLMTRLIRSVDEWPSDLDAVSEWLIPHIRRKYEDDIENRLDDLKNLAAIASTFESREQFLRELCIDPPESSMCRRRDDQAEDVLVLSTIHSAKGQEWQKVTILNVIDGCIPSIRAVKSQAEIEEERRLLYVGMTRAKDQLDLVVPQFHLRNQAPDATDPRALAKPSRFLPERIVRENFNGRNR